MPNDGVWCQKCGKLIQVTEAALVFSTVVKIMETGIYPYGFCHEHTEAKDVVMS